MAHNEATLSNEETWPELPTREHEDTLILLHMWLQVVGKVRLALASPLNHWWHASLHVSARGLSTGLIPLAPGALQLDFDFFDHNLLISVPGGRQRHITLHGRSVAGLYRELMRILRALGIEVEIQPQAIGVANPQPFANDTRSGYDGAFTQRLWRVLVEVHRVLESFRSPYVGKASPVQFFWGRFDLATSRFTGRMAPPGAVMPNVPETVVREAFSHEQFGIGFSPYANPLAQPVFYAYCYPEPDAFARRAITPHSANYNDAMKAFVLPYESVRTSGAPERTLQGFFSDTYRAAAEAGGWNPALLLRPDESAADQ